METPTELLKQNSVEWHERKYNNWKSSLDKHEERTLKELEKIKADFQKTYDYRLPYERAGKEHSFKMCMELIDEFIKSLEELKKRLGL